MRLAALVCLVLFCAVARAEEFACYVRFPSAAPSIVLVETASAANAARVAARAHSKGPPKRRENVSEVVECIPRITGRFADPAAQRLLDNWPI